MQVRAIYEDGQLTFQQPVRLKARRLVLEVTIPDDYMLDHDAEAPQHAKDSSTSKGLHNEIEAITGQKSTPSETRARLDAILGKWRHRGGESGKDVYKAMWHAHVEDKYLGER